MSTWYRDGKGGVIYTRKVSDGNYGSHEYGEWFEGEIGADTDIAKALATMKAGVKERVEQQITDFLNGASVDEIASELGGVATQEGAEVTKVGEPSGKLTVAVTPEEPPLPPPPPGFENPVKVEERTPVDDNGEDLEGFLVDYFIVDESQSGTKIAKTHGGRVKLHGAVAWPEVMEALVGITDLDKGQRFKPPYPVKAWCTKSDGGWPNKVQYFEKA